MLQGPPRVTVFAAAMTCGMLLALAAHVLAVRLGAALPLRLQQFQGDANPMAAALGWWTIASAGLIGSLLAGGLVQNVARDAPRRRFHPLLLGGLFFLVLAMAPYVRTVTPAPDLTDALAGNLLAFALATATAFCGSWFAIPRD